MPRISNITIWTESGKQRLIKKYLTMFIREAYLIYNEINLPKIII